MTEVSQLAQSAGLAALTNIIINLGCIYICWLFVQNLKIESIMKKPTAGQVRLLQILITIISGHLLATFMIDYWQWSEQLKGLGE